MSQDISTQVSHISKEKVKTLVQNVPNNANKDPAAELLLGFN